MALDRPPQRHARGGRRVLDEKWLAYLLSGGETGDGEQLTTDALLVRGLDEFNHGAFFESHETFEALWRITPYPAKLFCLSLTKLGAGLAHAQRGNRPGAEGIIAASMRFLAPFAPSFAGVDTGLLLNDVKLLVVEGIGPATPFPRIKVWG